MPSRNGASQTMCVISIDAMAGGAPPAVFRGSATMVMSESADKMNACGRMPSHGPARMP